MRSIARYVKAGCLALALAAPLAAGCSSHDDGAEEGQVGNLSLSLVGQAGSTTYRLRNALFEITGAQAASLDSEVDPDATSLGAVLQVGNYSIELQSGWVLERLDGAGYVPVEASLISPNPYAFEILANGITRATFRFSTDGQLVDIGDGQLLVDIEVVETVGADCTMFLPNGCPAGQYCYYDYDATTTGTCLPNGTSPLGGPCEFFVPGGCAAGLVCVYNNTCMELCNTDAPVCSSGACEAQSIGNLGVCR